jgi:hypothetical protein
MKFVMSRNRVVHSTTGHAVEFVKDIPSHVPPEMHREVMEAGAEPVEKLPEPKAPAGPKEPTEPDERKAAAFAAFAAIALRNKREEFGANGAPNAKALEAELKFPLPLKERDALWVEFTSAKAE